MPWKTILMRSFWYQKFEDPTIHVTVATCAKFWGFKFQNGFTHIKLRRRDLIFRYCQIIRTCSFTWAAPNKFSTTLLISGFISTVSHCRLKFPYLALKCIFRKFYMEFTQSECTIRKLVAILLAFVSKACRTMSEAFLCLCDCVTFRIHQFTGL